MFKFRLHKSQKDPESGDEKKIQENKDGDYDYHIREIFFGHHTIVTLIAFTVGGILVARSLFEVLLPTVGVMGTIAVGLLLFALGGYYAGSFRG